MQYKSLEQKMYNIVFWSLQRYARSVNGKCTGLLGPKNNVIQVFISVFFSLLLSKSDTLFSVLIKVSPSILWGQTGIGWNIYDKYPWIAILSAEF